MVLHATRKPRQTNQCHKSSESIFIVLLRLRFCASVPSEHFIVYNVNIVSSCSEWLRFFCQGLGQMLNVGGGWFLLQCSGAEGPSARETTRRTHAHWSRSLSLPLALMKTHYSECCKWYICYSLLSIFHVTLGIILCKQCNRLTLPTCMCAGCALTMDSNNFHILLAEDSPYLFIIWQRVGVKTFLARLKRINCCFCFCWTPSARLVNRNSNGRRRLHAVPQSYLNN